MAKTRIELMEKSNATVQVLTRYSDILLACLVVMIVAMMILPLPTFLIDILLTINISISIIIMLVSLYIPTALRIASFPSILLITTLFRLALNVSTTRLVLLQADAGEVVRAFGNFVVQGNMAVGGVIFLILTLINFIVISKGSERVAEVAARFNLDAMPGKQMSIDADLRAGSIDLPEARSKRRELERESQFFGAMDGAMKFVKGDAIAGIIITFINILGGIIIGVALKKMEIANALNLYGLLTIGDGLVSQIPALIISTSAGLIVTRVAPETAGDHLGRDIGHQFLAYPKAIGITSGLLLGLGFVPGLPTIPFWTLSAATGALAYLIYHAHDKSAHVDENTTPGLPQDINKKDGELSISLPIPVTLMVGMGLYNQLLISGDSQRNPQEFITEIKQHIYLNLGVKIPGIKIDALESGIKDNEYAILISEIPVNRGYFQAQQAVVRQPVQEIRHVFENAESINLPHLNEEVSLIPISQIDAALDLGYEVLDARALLSQVLIHELKFHANEFIGIQEIKSLCDELEQFYPDTVREVIPRIISYRRLADVCTRLIQEEVSIRHLKKILDILSEYAGVEKDTTALVEMVRSRLSRQITSQYTTRQGMVPVFLIDIDIEDTIKNSIQENEVDKVLIMDPDTIQNIVNAFTSAFQSQDSRRRKIVLTMDQSIRYVLWKFINHQFPGTVVLSILDLTPDVQLMPVGKISFN